MASYIPELSTGSNGVYSDENKENRPVQQEKVHKVAQKVDLKPAEGKARVLNAVPQNDVTLAIRGKKWDVFFQILQNSPAIKLSVEERGLALLASIKRGRFALVSTLLAGGRVSEQDLGKAVVESINLGHPEIAEILLRQLGNGRLLQTFLDQAIKLAADLGHLESVKILLAYGEISETTRGQAVIKAIKVRKPEIVQCLLNSGYINEVYREKALKEAKKIDHREIIEILEKI